MGLVYIIVQKVGTISFVVLLFIVWFVGKDCAKFSHARSMGFLRTKNVIFSIFLINFAALLKL